MSLLQLSTELFDTIMRLYVRTNSLKKTARAREVCRTFNNYIPEEILYNAASVPLATLRDLGEYKVYLKYHIAGVLRVKFLRKRSEYQFLKFLKSLVEDTVAQEWPMDMETLRKLRSQYARNIYDALAGVEYRYMHELIVDKIIPCTQSRRDLRAVAAAAVGNAQMLFNNITTAEA